MSCPIDPRFVKLKSKIMATASVAGPVVSVKEVIGVLIVAPNTSKLPKVSEPSVQNGPGALSVEPWLKVPLTMVRPGVQAGVAEAKLSHAMVRAKSTPAPAVLAVLRRLR